MGGGSAGLRATYYRVHRIGRCRVHLDIEADDVEAEVRRLEALGARRVEQVQTWWVMEAPTGQRFCVVRRFSPAFDQQANAWP